MILIRSVLSEVRRDPLRAILTMLGLSLGVAIVTLTVNVGNTLLTGGSPAFRTPGARLAVANATVNAGGEIRFAREPVFTPRDMEAIRRQVSGVTAITPVAAPRVATGGETDWSRILVGETLYATRSVLAVGAEYAEVFDLDMAAGTFFTTQDLARGAQIVVLSEGTARALYGSAEEALGQSIGARRDPDKAIINTTVVGVFRDVAAQTRVGYGIPDILLPLNPSVSDLVAFVARIAPKAGAATADAITAVLRGLHGAETEIAVWEGDPFAFGDARAEQDREILSITLFLDAFGALALIIASTGVVTMAMVGIVERTRSIGLRRTLGSTKAAIVGWLVSESVLLASVAALVGVGLAAVFVGPANAAFAPAIPGPEGARAALPGVLRVDAVLIGLGAGLVAAALFSFLPALAAARVQPVESVRET